MSAIHCLPGLKRAVRAAHLSLELGGCVGGIAHRNGLLDAVVHGRRPPTGGGLAGRTPRRSIRMVPKDVKGGLATCRIAVSFAAKAPADSPATHAKRTWYGPTAEGGLISTVWPHVRQGSRRAAPLAGRRGEGRWLSPRRLAERIDTAGSSTAAHTDAGRGAHGASSRPFPWMAPRTVVRFGAPPVLDDGPTSLGCTDSA